jgi:hypothetical protein
MPSMIYLYWKISSSEEMAAKALGSSFLNDYHTGEAAMTCHISLVLRATQQNQTQCADSKERALVQLFECVRYALL